MLEVLQEVWQVVQDNFRDLMFYVWLGTTGLVAWLVVG